MNITLLKTAGANATGSGAASNFGFAQSVYVVARGANDIVTSSANTTFFTPIGYPRG